MNRVIDFKVRQTNDDEKKTNMPYITSSMLEAVNTCPRWGIINNVQAKAFTVGFRQMALEAGSLMHEVFSLLNLYQVGVLQRCNQHMEINGIMLFNKERWEHILGEDFNKIYEAAEQNPDKHLIALEKMAYRLIGTSDFYDDPDDRNRTVANLEHCAIELINYWWLNMAHFDIYIEDRDIPSSRVGIELSFDVVFEMMITTEDGEIIQKNVRYIGLGDAVYQNQETKMITLGEYKTASSMNEGWREAFRTRHQITAYNACLAAYFDYNVVSDNTILIGSGVPVRKTKAPVQMFQIDRDKEHTLNFLTTVLHTQNTIETYQDDVLTAPMFTHSCNRYFRPCSLIDLCSSSYDDQQVMYEQMLNKPELSPSEMKALIRSS